jgi:hypothetical protein
MQFILTREELDALVPRTELQAAQEALIVARKAILKAAGYTCIHDRIPDEHGRRYGGYCDSCPVSRIGMPAWVQVGPQERRPTPEEQQADRLICRLGRSYGK